MAADSQSDAIHRALPDRRRQPTTFWSALRPGGRRISFRRASEHAQPYFVDRHPVSTFLLILLLLGLSITDAILTLILIQEGAEEVNPLMKRLLDQGLQHFLIGKYILTAAGIPLLVVFKNFYLFGTRFRVGYLIPLFIVLYLILVSYQITLIR